MTPYKLTSALLVVTLTLSSTASASGNESETCIQAHLSAQRLRKDGSLRAARDELLTCARPQCPALARDECATWLNEISSEIPTVLVSALDASGQDISAVRVTIDGAPRLGQLDGRPLELDPGQHVFRFETAGAEPIEQRVFLNQGERSRLLRVQFRAGPAYSAAALNDEKHDAQRPSPVVGFAALGVGAVALGSFALFGITGRNRENYLADHCAPNCQTSARDDVLRDYRIADVSLGVAAIAIGLGTWLVLRATHAQ